MSRRTLRDNVAELGELVDSAFSDPLRWNDISHCIQRIIPGSKVSFQVVETRSTEIPVSAGAGWSGAAGHAYAEHYWKLDPFNPLLGSIPPLTFLRSSEIIPDATLRKTEFYADFLHAEREAESSTALVLGSHRHRRAVFGIAYASRAAERRHHDVEALMMPLVLRMRSALEAGRLVARRPTTEGGTLVGAFTDPAMIVDGDSRLLAANMPAEQLLGDRKGWRLGPGERLQIADQRLDAALVRLVRSTCGPFTDPAGAGDFIVDLGPDATWTVTGLPVSARAAGLLAPGSLPLYVSPRALLLVLRPSLPSTADISVVSLRRRFGLTPSEGRLVLELQKGGTLAEIADRLGVARATVQSHLKAIFLKTGTSRQRDLLTTIHGYGPTDGDEPLSER